MPWRLNTRKERDWRLEPLTDELAVVKNEKNHSIVLSLLIFCSSELPITYLEYCLASLREWNSDGLPDCQVIVISQLRDSQPIFDLCKAQPFPVIAVCADQPYADDGYPIWDTCQQIDQVKDLIVGKYVCVMHSEFVWCYSRLKRTIDWLRTMRPYMALGNLRRPALADDIKIWKFPTCNELLSANLVDVLESALRNGGNWAHAALMHEIQTTIQWMYWNPQPIPGKTAWLEDLFFVNWEWMNTWHGYSHGGRLPFQDIYDLMGIAMNIMHKYEVRPTVYRMGLDVNRVVHLWHPKVWGSYTAAVRDWFLNHIEEWEGTRYADITQWDELVDARKNGMPTNEKPVIDLRRGPGGTVTRYGVALSEYLREGGGEALSNFYKQNGVEFLEKEL